MAEVLNARHLRNDQIIYWMLSHPGASLSQCARIFGITPAWLSTLTRTDGFQQRMSELRGDYQDCTLPSIRDKLLSCADLAVEKLTDALEKSADPDYILETADKVLHRLGYAPTAKAVQAGPQIVQNFVVSREDLAAGRARIVNSSERQSPIALESLPGEGDASPS